MGELKLYKQAEFNDLVAALNSSFTTDFGCVLLLEQPLSEKQTNVLKQRTGVICLATGPAWTTQLPDYILGYIQNPSDPLQIEWGLESARRLLDLHHQDQQLRFRLQMERERLEAILESTTQISEERDPLKLCEKVLGILRKQTRAEGASLYLADLEKDLLHFVSVQNEVIQIEVKSFSLPINENSMAGACAVKKELIHEPDVRKIPASSPYKFNDESDRKHGYQTRSVVSLPLIKSNGDLIGVVQLINSKRESGFSNEDLDLARILSAPIAASLETALLYQDIENLFEGFIKASVVAIESRDPATSGHSERVALLTVSLAEVVDESTEKAFKDFRMSEQSFKELRYASLLHDFGKIGVPEHVLQKEKKLYPQEMIELRHRAELIKAAHPEAAHEIDTFLHAVLMANEPTVVHEKPLDLSVFVNREYSVFDQRIPLLTPDELGKLSLQKGSLNDEDRQLIQSHVEHTYRFLAQIPWTRGLKNVPHIAHSHHEKLDGTGYPQRLKAHEIPLESQMMAIADIYDALTAPDRPYKKSVPVERALHILKDDASKGKLNTDLVDIFISRSAYSRQPRRF
jgi:HD-GYP domain-containing protein (c-di-GMP phosphodiesterase class II)